MKLFSVGDIAARLGVTASTVRMWGERYQLVASARSEGGHRRYTTDDLDRLQRMHEAVLAGTAPAAAARAALDRPATVPDPRRRGGPGGSVLAVPGASAAARGLARAASRLDEPAVEDAIVQAMERDGTLPTWNDVVLPVLVAAGEHWHRTGAGIEIEHLLTQAVSTACVRYGVQLPVPARERPVLLAGGPTEEHVLPLHALRVALIERGVPARLLGPQTPMSTLATVARRTRAGSALIWLSTPDPTAVAGLAEVIGAHRRMRALVGGPGWVDSGVDPAIVCSSLKEATDLLESTWTRPSATSSPSAR